MNNNHSGVSVNSPGPAKGKKLERLSTKLAALLGTIAKRNPGRVIPLDTRKLAAQLGCSWDYVRKLLWIFRDEDRGAWFFQHYHAALFLRYAPHPMARAGFPRFYLVRSSSLHLIGPRARYHLRRFRENDWTYYMQWLKNLAISLLSFGESRGDGKPKAIALSTIQKYRGANAPPAEDRRRLRGHGWVAGRIQAAFAAESSLPPLDIRGWCKNRLAEGHTIARIRRALTRAEMVYNRRQELGYMDRPPAWFCAVATGILERDGMTIEARWHWRKWKREASKATDAAGAAAQNEEKQKSLAIPTLYKKLTDWLGETFYLDPDNKPWIVRDNHLSRVDWVRYFSPSGQIIIAK